jgi:hypothetical protein
VAVLAFVLAELATLQHQAEASACAELGERAHAGATLSLELGERAGWAARVAAVDPLAAGELAQDLCQLCRSSRERFAAPATSAIYADGRADLGAAPPMAYAGVQLGAAVYTVAPKTSPPA